MGISIPLILWGGYINSHTILRVARFTFTEQGLIG